MIASAPGPGGAAALPPRNAIRFLLGDVAQELRGFDPTMTVLDWLRTEARRIGTKEGCNEGDCGACTVVLVRPRGGRVVWRAVNACILLLGQLDGAQLLTVEDLKQDGGLHPVQQALVDCHGSQCGFCTPGFVMSLFALGREARAGGEAPAAPDEAAIDDALAGNLCRCTGYAPIVRAARFALAEPWHDRFAAAEAATRARLAALEDEADIAVRHADGRRFYAPATADALAALLQREPGARIVAGATDVGLWVTKRLMPLDPVVWIGRVRGLDAVVETEDAIEIGATATYADAGAALAAWYPDLGELFRRLGGAQVRATGTIGGNVANGSPIGDSPPALIAAGATLHLRRGDARRAMPLEDFFLAYGCQDRAPDEFVERVTLPKPAPGTRFRAYKVSKRFDQDISAVLGAFSLRVVDGAVAAVRIAYGGMAATPKRARAAEAALLGRRWTERTVAEAQAALAEDFRPISDMRASAGYRMQVARNLLLRLLLETTQPELATRLAGDR
ncbi:MAG TPA: xanthine dehydrogenase small subunit, partial [Acetobacteraceae bacterium]|nr:xanthine dehydrogenase small subunit [Acetobacteraceae bacterium]